MRKLKIGMVTSALPYYPAYVAEERGLFKARGIESEVEIAGATDKVTTSLEKGRTQIAMVTPEGVIGNAARGGPLRLVAGNANRAPLALIGLKCIKKIEELRGKKVGTSSLKEGTAILVQKMMQAHGLQYPGDYEFAIVGPHPQRWERLKEASIDAALQLIPYDYLAEEAGFVNLGQAADYVPHYAFTAIALNLDWARKNRDFAVAALAAMREAVEWAADNINAAAEILGRRSHSSLEHSRRAMHEMFDRQVSPKDLKIDRSAIQVVFESMHEFGLVEKEVALTYDACVDESYLAAGLPGRAATGAALRVSS
jgi:ABC-type nitrate/sulfonate/bicarbonate transport system substrate-binding protein